jgi:hypothetical protein
MMLCGYHVSVCVSWLVCNHQVCRCVVALGMSYSSSSLNAAADVRQGVTTAVGSTVSGKCDVLCAGRLHAANDGCSPSTTVLKLWLHTWQHVIC